MTSSTDDQATADSSTYDRFGPDTVGEEVVLEVKDLRTYFTTRWGTVKAVDGVSYQVRRGETLGIVGESGSGKSVQALSVMRLVPSPPGHIVGGEVLLASSGMGEAESGSGNRYIRKDILQVSESEMTRIRGGEIAMILQDPMTALNPVFTIENQVGEAITIHQGLKGKPLWEKIIEALRHVRIPAAEQRAKDYPHQLSGGMRQRVVGAIGISSTPSVIIADEPNHVARRDDSSGLPEAPEAAPGRGRRGDHLHHARLRDCRQDV